ncbi:MAG TPA: hypothetical protein VF590_20195 [Isosphaeraceae bacterium]
MASSRSSRRMTLQDRMRREPDRRRPAARATPSVEPLEGRALLSPLNARPDGDHAFQQRRGAPLEFLNIATGTGHANQAPRFRRGYAGPRLPSLNVAAATARVDGSNLVLTATLAGPIIARPTSADQEAIYTFGIDRGGASQDGPLPGRSHWTFDSVAVVQVRRSGVTGSTQFIMASTAATNPGLRSPVTALSPRNIAIEGDALRVTVPLNQLPSSGSARNQYRVTFSARSPTLKGVRSIASIIPPDDTFRVLFPSPIPVPR